jgi:hypothetical protein
LSLITGVISGIQGASAAHNAANAQVKGYTSAAGDVNAAVTAANPGITSAAQAAGAGVTGAASQAATGATAAANTAIAGVSPYTSAGANATQTLGGMMAPGGQLNTPFNASMMAQSDPGYQFQEQQGQNALARSAAASGLTGSGGTLKAAMRYNQDYANTAYNNAFNQYQTQNTNTFNRLSTVMGMGQQAGEYAGNVGTQAAQYGGNINTGAAQYAGTLNNTAADNVANNQIQAGVYSGNAAIGAGNATAQGDMNAANAWNGMLNGVGSFANTAMMGGFSGGGSTLGGMMGFGGGGPNANTPYFNPATGGAYGSTPAPPASNTGTMN